jgi:hypothetical protein
MTTKTTAPRKARPAASEDAAFFKAYREWRAAERAFCDACNHAEAVEWRERDKLPKPPDIAIALDYHSYAVLVDMLERRLKDILTRG